MAWVIIKKLIYAKLKRLGEHMKFLGHGLSGRGNLRRPLSVLGSRGFSRGRKAVALLNLREEGRAGFAPGVSACGDGESSPNGA